MQRRLKNFIALFTYSAKEGWREIELFTQGHNVVCSRTGNESRFPKGW